MNNTFDIKRFTMLFKKHSIEHAKTYLLSTAVLTGIMFLILGFITYTNKGHIEEKTQGLFFTFLIMAAGSIFTSMAFLELGDKKKAIPYLALPASHFEKYLVSWLYSYVIFQLVFLGCFYFADEIIMQLTNPSLVDKNQLVNIFSAKENWRDAFVAYAVLNGLTLWGAVFFEKLHFIKTAFIFFICLLLLVLFNNQLLMLIVDGNVETHGNMPFSGFGFGEGVQFWRIFPDKSLTQYNYYIIVLTAILLWATAYFRLKEKEV